MKTSNYGLIRFTINVFLTLMFLVFEDVKLKIVAIAIFWLMFVVDIIVIKKQIAHEKEVK